MLYIERPSGKDIRDERVELTVRDENGLRAATLVIAVGVGSLDDIVKITALTIPGDGAIAIETAVVQR